jgi:dihydropteroate synthase
MGVLNVTPDSFYDGGRHNTVDAAVARARVMIQEGAHIIDIGGESTRPGAQAVSIQEECDRVVPVIEKLRQETALPISIDTRHASVMLAAIAAGADIVNDVSGLCDPGAIGVVAKHKVKVCIMHMQGTPETMQESPTYDNVVQEIQSFFHQRIELCEKAGILRENIWIDPGFGFGKTLAHNLTLLAKLAEFESLNCKILVGLSRKSMFGKILDKPADQRLYGSLAGAVLAAMHGASIFRTHDVAATKDVLAVVKAISPYMHSRHEDVPVS